MKAHKFETQPRNGGYLARCRDCDAITFGGFPTRTAAREALAAEHLRLKDTAPGAAGTATEGTHQATRKGNAMTTTSVASKPRALNLEDLASYEIEVLSSKADAAEPTRRVNPERARFELPIARVWILPESRIVRVQALLEGEFELTRASRIAARVRNGEAFDEEGFDFYRETVLPDGQGALTATVNYTTPACQCARPGCKERGEWFEKSDSDEIFLNTHFCTAEFESTHPDVEVFYDDESVCWTVGLSPRDVLPTTEALQLAEALTAAVRVADALNDGANA